MSGRVRSGNSQTLLRSLRLFRQFLLEQSDPEAFYTALAEDTCNLLSRYVDFSTSSVVDIGGGPGYFAEAVRKRGAKAVTVDCSTEEMTLHARKPSVAVVGDGVSLPLKSECFDLVHSSNVLEHVPCPEEFIDEAVRVAKSSGVIFLSFTVWLSPWGGHETSPWHLFGGEWAARKYERAHGRPPKNRYLKTLFPMYVSEFERLLRARQDVTLLDSFPRYYPSWAAFLSRLAVIRELATWNYAAILSKQ